MKTANSLLSLVVLGLGISTTALWGCSSDNVSSVTTAGTTSSSGEAGKGGAGGGGSGGTGGMASGGAGGAGGGMAGAGGTGGAGPTCVKPADACAGCLYDQCQLAYCECNDEPACFGLIGCIQQCPPNDGACAGGCYLKNAVGFAEFTIASSCAASLCAPSCPGSDQVKPCDLCLAQKCEMQLETCLANAECFPLIDCRNKCMGDMMCEQKCNMMFPNGQPLVQSLFVCASMGCGGSCN